MESGILIVSPSYKTFIARLLSICKFFIGVPYLFAMDHKVSPFLTLYDAASVDIGRDKILMLNIVINDRFLSLFICKPTNKFIKDVILTFNILIDETYFFIIKKCV